MMKGKFPSMSVKNGLFLADITDPDHKLTEIENNLIALNIIFQKIFLLPKSRMSAVKDRLVNVPVTASDVLNTVENIPRTPREAGLIQVKLKRKLKYKNYHKQEYIDPEKIFKTLEHLRNSGHPYYQFYDDYSTFRKRCREESLRDQFDEVITIKKKAVTVYICDSDTETIIDLNEKLNTEHEEETHKKEESDSDFAQNDEDEYVKKDPVRKYQFDHNISTCLTNKFPELLANDDGEEDPNDFSFAPGDGKTPKNIFMDVDWDIKAWPSLHPDGKYGLHHNRKVNLTEQKYFTQRIGNKDRRFEENPGYVFAAATYIERKQLQNNANISFSRGKKTQTCDKLYTLNDPYTVFENVKNTPKYWQKYKYEMIGKLENLGPFQWFFTLSCADMRWDENFSSLLEELNLTIKYEVSALGVSTTTVYHPGSEDETSLREYLKIEQDESLHELIRTNVLNATRNFQHRVDAFMNNIVFGDNNPMNIKHMYELQG